MSNIIIQLDQILVIQSASEKTLMKVTPKACLWQGAWHSVLGIPLSDSVINYINEK